MVRGAPDSGSFMAFWLSGGHVTAAMHANDWGTVDALRDLVLSRAAVSPPRLADPSVPVEELIGAGT